MEMKELAEQYEEAAEMVARRIKVLAVVEEHLPFGRERMALGHRIRALRQMRDETRELSGHIRHYYDRGARRNARYTL